MELVEIGTGCEHYKRGYRVGVSCKRYENTPMITNFYDFWLQQQYVEHLFDVSFTMDNESNCVLCFKSKEDLFLAMMAIGFVIEN